MTAFNRLILRNNLFGMSNLLEIIEQLRSNQEAFSSKLAKVEDLGSKVSKSVLRDLIQDARELHEGTVVLSYILFNEENNIHKGEQLEIPLNNQEPQLDVVSEGQGLTEEEELLDALDQALEFTHQEIETESLVSEISQEINEIEEEYEIVESPQFSEEEIPSQEELTGQLEQEISSVISNFTAVPEPNHEAPKGYENVEEDNSLAAKLAKQKIENLNSAIGINEKFLFTNELFEGNTEQFLKTIDDLNNCSNLDEANSKLSTIAEKRNWELEEEPFQKLQSLLLRKYQ